MTTFADTVYGNGGIPLLGQAAGVPIVGTPWFVDPVNGSDGNIGNEIDTPLKTLQKAHDKAADGKNDVIFLIGNGQLSGSARLSATLAWTKNALHLIGVCSPIAFSQRARIAATAGVNFTPLVLVSGSGCIFQNVQAFHGYDDASAQVCWQESGQRNFYNNVHFAGMGHATAGAHVGGRNLLIDGGAGAPTPTAGLGEHVFQNCVIGIDTIARSAANASLEMSHGTPRNVFRGCIFESYATSATALTVKTAAAAAIDRTIFFQNCLFNNNVKSGAGTAQTALMSIAAAAGGQLVLDALCVVVGATDVEAVASNQIFVGMAAPSAAAGGLAVNNS